MSPTEEVESSESVWAICKMRKCEKEEVTTQRNRASHDGERNLVRKELSDILIMASWQLRVGSSEK